MNDQIIGKETLRNSATGLLVIVAAVCKSSQKTIAVFGVRLAENGLVSFQYLQCQWCGSTKGRDVNGSSFGDLVLPAGVSRTKHNRSYLSSFIPVV